MVADLVVLHVDHRVGLFLLFDHGAVRVTFLSLQLLAGKVLHDAGADRVAQHVGGGTQPVPAESGET